MSIQTTFTFEAHDKLNRKPFADFLLSLIQHRNEYRRPDSNASYAIAIDAAYGSGKTRFLKMLQSMVQDTKNYSVIYYSAWEHDLYDDALSPIYSLLDKPGNVLGDQSYDRMEIQLGKKALRVLKTMCTSFAAMEMKKHFGKNSEEIINDVKALFSGDTTDIDAYALQMKCVSELQKGLKKATEDIPLIFIIDELDRCNPSFAIKTLEVAKHLLDVDNVIFIFALDMQQMRAAIRKFYGQDIDADGYLCKIFDYMTMLPAPNSLQYIRGSFHNIDPALRHSQNLFFSLACNILLSEHCTLRFIDTFLSAFRILWHTFLKQLDSEDLSLLYFIALFLKYKYPVTFQAMAGSSPLTPEDKTLIRHFTDRDTVALHLIDLCTVTIKEASGRGLLESHVRMYRDNPSHFNEIKHLTYGQFIHRQLEMYNPIRTEEPVENSPTT